MKNSFGKFLRKIVPQLLFVSSGEMGLVFRVLNNDYLNLGA